MTKAISFKRFTVELTKDYCGDFISPRGKVRGIDLCKERMRAVLHLPRKAGDLGNPLYLTVGCRPFKDSFPVTRMGLGHIDIGNKANEYLMGCTHDYLTSRVGSGWYVGQTIHVLFEVDA